MYGVDLRYGNPYYEDGTTETFIESFTVESAIDSLFDIDLEIPKRGIRLLEIDTK